MNTSAKSKLALTERPNIEYPMTVPRRGTSTLVVGGLVPISGLRVGAGLPDGREDVDGREDGDGDILGREDGDGDILGREVGSVVISVHSILGAGLVTKEISTLSGGILMMKSGFGFLMKLHLNKVLVALRSCLTHLSSRTLLGLTRHGYSSPLLSV